MTPDELADLLQQRPPSAPHVELRVRDGRHSLATCGLYPNHGPTRCGKPTVYTVHWDMGKRSSFCGPHTAEVRKAYQSRIVKIEERG